MKRLDGKHGPTYPLYDENGHYHNGVHNIKVMGGFQADEMRQSFFSARKYGLLLYDLPEFDLSSSLDGDGKERIPEVGGYSNEWATLWLIIWKHCAKL
jgi:hypothetical protein